MHYLLLSVGSTGDVLPLITIGAALRHRGHAVTLAAHTVYSQLAAQHQLAFIPLSTDEDYERSSGDTFLLHSRYYGLFFLRHAVPWNLRIYKAITNLAGDDLVVVAVDRANLWADLVAYAELEVPVVRVKIDLPLRRDVINGFVPIPFGPVQEYLTARCQAAWTETMRRSGFRVGPNQLLEVTTSTRPKIPTLGLWPSWITSGDARYASSITACGFVPPPSMIYQPLQIPFGQREGRLLLFMTGTRGTTKSWVQPFADVSAAISHELNCNGVLLGAADSDTSDGKGSWFICRTFMPLCQVMPHSTAIVHHGGIGTAAMAMTHGVPQLIIPRVFAQPSNAEWLRRLGVCRVLEPRSYTTKYGTRAIDALLNDDNCRRRASEISETLKSGASVVAYACDYVEAARYRLRSGECPKSVSSRSVGVARLG
jgi:rhamnosyltransferase subunit B